MKKLFILSFLACGLTFGAQAQNTVRVGDSGGGGLAYNEGDKIFMVGVSFGTYGYGLGSGRSIGVPPLTAALEFGIHENFSVGPYVGYASWNFNNFGLDYGWNFLAVGARGSFHYVPVLNEALDLSLDEEKFDFYVTLIIGLEFQSFTGDDNFGGVFGENYSNSSTGVQFGPVLGFKYKFNDKFGVYFEGGRGAFGYGTIGLAVHL
ncbi:MAG: hypothetical protein WA958_17475 [Tunicatimonas sp.]